MKKESSRIRLIPPGYFASRTIVKELRDFRDLALYYIPFVGYSDRASRPLEEIICEDINSARKKYDVLEQKIDELIPIIKRHLSRAGIETRIISQGYEPGSLKIIEKEYDLISDIFQLPRKLDAKICDMLVSAIDRGIGFYKRRNRDAFRELFNPIFWVAYVFRIPLLIIHMMGLVSNEEAASRMLKVYIWLFRIVFFVILVFIATKLGISINWVKILSFFK